MQKITPFLWFDDNAEEAMEFYISIFKNSKMGSVSRYTAESAKAAGRPEGSVMAGSFEIEGQEFAVLNGGPIFKFTEAISFMVNCETQEEVDELWTKLTADGGEEGKCGWVKDKFGVSWQIVPTILNDLLNDPDPGRAGRAMQAMLQMNKIDGPALQAAADQT